MTTTAKLKRYDFVDNIEEATGSLLKRDDDGLFCYYDDVSALEARNRELEAEMATYDKMVKPLMEKNKKLEKVVKLCTEAMDAERKVNHPEECFAYKDESYYPRNQVDPLLEELKLLCEVERGMRKAKNLAEAYEKAGGQVRPFIMDEMLLNKEKIESTLDALAKWREGKK